MVTRGGKADDAGQKSGSLPPHDTDPSAAQLCVSSFTNVVLQSCSRDLKSPQDTQSVDIH